MLTRTQLAELLEEQDQPVYRTTQILDWIYKKRARSWEEMSNLPPALRAALAEKYPLRPLTHTLTKGSADTTRKFLLELPDKRYIETVLIPASPALYGETSDRHTLCVSSQVGCAYACKFCASGLDGFTRNLTAAEIVSQVILAEELSGEKVNNLVFMGMGEPLANFTNLCLALDMITSDWGLNIGARRITVSTSGLVPQIRKLAELPQQIRLAISLHGSDDETREKIMPVNKKYPLDELFDSLRLWNSKKNQKITLEYILIDGVNADPEHAQTLAKRAASIRAKVNLIPYNTVEGLQWSRPSDEDCLRFKSVLTNANVSTTLRLEKGHDIDAACGQLRLKKEKAEI
jgi:23S rRNA (adenine2503-C2)-methyltransferase|tara:strand:+ start:8455 stop:9495 length:1041 start_codon:yes stop_codon:yes gene_type:complete